MKMTQVEAISQILNLLNRMNISLTAVMTTVSTHYREDDKDCKVFHDLNMVMNGITSLTSIYAEAQKQATEAATSLEVTSASVNDSSDKSTPKNTAAAALLSQGKDRILNSIKKTIEGVSSLGETSTEQELNDMVEKCVSDKLVPPKEPVQGRLAELIGSNGLLYRYLSNEVDQRGKGSIKPCERFPAFIEDVLEVPISELQYYPEGFYNTIDNKSHQLLLKFSNIDYLWLFTLQESELHIRNGAEWKSVVSIPVGSVKMVYQMIDVHLQTYNLKE